MAETVAVAVAASPKPSSDHGMATSVAVSQFVGAVLFSFGSACFVWMAWADDWVLPWRIGCALWIGGCVPYLWPPLVNERFGIAGTHVSNALQAGGMLSWAVGSAVAFQDDVDAALPITNGAYLAGSACLLCDALLQARQLRSATRDEQLSLLGDLLAGVFYVLAGWFGGYATQLSLIRFGNVCWLAGSLISSTRPCLALSAERRRGRAARTAKEVVKEVQVPAVASTTSAV
jgi:hypothetical protein